MTRRTGTLEEREDGGRRLWVRCPLCGDSERRPWVAHAVIDLETGRFHCFRCSQSTTVPDWYPVRPTELTRGTPLPSVEAEASSPTPLFSPGSGTGRPSAMLRFRQGSDDIFFSTSGGFMRVQRLVTPAGERFSKRSVGPTRSGLGLGRFLSLPLASSYDSPIVIVEGPYDVLDGFSDACLFGAIPTRAQLELLEGQYVVLRPDADIFSSPSMQRALYRTWLYSRSIVVGVDRIPGDPDTLQSHDEIERVGLSALAT